MRNLDRPAWWGPVSLLLWGLVIAAVVTTIVRFATGIATIANINQAYPWGWWVGFRSGRSRASDDDPRGARDRSPSRHP